MAAAEARAAWQRTANRCFVQEDAKRAPKLACCPSASSSSKQVDAGPASGTDAPENPIVGFIPLHRKPSYSNLPPDSRWWLHMQPNYVHQRDFINEQLNYIEVQMETNRGGVVSSTSKLSGVPPQCGVDGIPVDDSMNSELSFDTHSVISATSLKKDLEVRQQELKAMYCKNTQEPLKPKGMGKSCELIEMEPIDCSVSKETDDLCFNLDSPWIVGAKTEPWWRAADRDELASLVAQRSLDLIENCDLPQPQKTNVKRDPYAPLGNVDYNGILPSSIAWEAQDQLSDPNVHAKGHPISGYAYGRELASVEGHAQYSLDKLISDSTSQKGMTETQISESNASKAQLLEALCHSQTRAREAENAAKQAYAEKEHIIKLFFRQASHLFAYKQWFQLLQLENLYFQLKNNQQPISTLIPTVLPWVPHKTKKQRKSWRADSRGRGGKRGRPRYDGSKLAVAVALGLSLVGAGLLLGWTVGWMFPTL